MILNLFGGLIAVLAIGLPVAWVVSEFRGRLWIRLILGTISILLSFGIAVLVGSLERLQSNTWFGTVSEGLIDATIDELEAGNQDGVLRELKTLRREYSPTYENRAGYDVLVAEAVARMRAGSPPLP